MLLLCPVLACQAPGTAHRDLITPCITPVGCFLVVWAAQDQMEWQQNHLRSMLWTTTGMTSGVCVILVISSC